MFSKYDDNYKLIHAPMELVSLQSQKSLYTATFEYVIEVFGKIIQDKEIKVRVMKLLTKLYFSDTLQRNLKAVI